VLESYKAACLLVDWVMAVIAGGMSVDSLLSGSRWEKWLFLDYISKPDVVSYEHVRDREKLLLIMAGLELALLLSTEKDESFAIRREWQKLGRWMSANHGVDPAAHGLSFVSLMKDEDEANVSKALIFMIEHLPELKFGWSEGRSDALDDYLYVLWLEARQG
jgi:hypothetical protein